jgi:uncharacterized protein (DUF2252 family)
VGQVSADRSGVVHLSVGERAASGKAARARVALGVHGEWAADADRPNPVSLIEEQDRSRLPDLLPIRHGRMAASPFAFFRGAASVFAADLSVAPATGIDAQLCGDAHLSNFGGFASPERTMVFDVNDFDETLPGPFEWDVKRLAASLEIAARQSGAKPAVRTGIVTQAVRSYRRAMLTFATSNNLKVWYARLDVPAIARAWGRSAGARAVRNFDTAVLKAETKDQMKAMAKLTHWVDGELRIVSDPPLIVPIEEVLSDVDAERIADSVRAVFRSYRRTLQGDRRHLLESYRLVHVARKVVGVGSVGTQAWVCLLLGRDNADPLFLQVKQALPSVLEPFLTKSTFSNHGQRVVEGQRVMQAASDIFLGWERGLGADGQVSDFYVRQLWDWKASANIETMTQPVLGIYGQMCGWTLARAHARSGDRVAIASYLGNSRRFEDAIAAFANAYADQNDRDHLAFVRVMSNRTRKSGR